MKIKINKSIIENIVSNMQSFLEKKDNSQITSHIYIEANENRLLIKATDYEMYLETEVKNIDIETNGIITANGKKLLDIIKILKNEDIILEKDEENLIIKQNKTIFKLQTFNANEYPKFQKIEDKNILNCNSLEIINALKKIFPTIDQNNPKFELNGALIDIKNDYINIVSTDTKRLSIIKIDENKNENENQLIIPKRAISEIIKIFFDNIEVFYDENSLIIKSNNYTLHTKLINGTYPNYERIIPTNFKHNINLPKDKVTESIKIINSISHNIKIKISKNSINFESTNEENSEAKTNFEFNSNIDDFTIIVTSKFISDFLNLIDNNEFTLNLNEEKLPFVIESNKLKTIIMPIII
jgi:DNA polymerase-3 subunit beta